MANSSHTSGALQMWGAYSGGLTSQCSRSSLTASPTQPRSVGAPSLRRAVTSSQCRSPAGSRNRNGSRQARPSSGGAVCGVYQRASGTTSGLRGASLCQRTKSVLRAW